MGLVIILGLFGMGIFTFSSSIIYYFYIEDNNSNVEGGISVIDQAKLDKI